MRLVDHLWWIRGPCSPIPVISFCIFFFSTNMYLPFQLSVLCLSCINAVIVTLCEMSKYGAIRQVVTVGLLLKSRCSFQTSGRLLVVKIVLQNSEASKNHFPPSRATPQLSLNKTLSTQLSPSWTNTCVPLPFITTGKHLPLRMLTVVSSVNSKWAVAVWLCGWSLLACEAAHHFGPDRKGVRFQFETKHHWSLRFGTNLNRTSFILYLKISMGLY